VNNLPFDQPGHFWKGNLHTHSTLSDGHLSPQAVCDFYREAGYHFLALTDHFLKSYNFPIADTRPYRTDNFTTLLGAELHAGYTAFGSRWHILAVGLPLDFAPPDEDETGPQIAGRALETGAFVVAAHPYWYNLTESDILSLGPIHAVEVFNGTSHDHNDRADSWQTLETLLERGHRYSACATDDAHFHPDRADALLGWVWVKSETLTPETVLTALKQGHYYSSTGPEIFDIRLESGRLTVRCSPASRVFVTGAIYHARSVYGNGLTQAAFDLTNFDSPYCRVIVRDSLGRRAWSNPIWF
jgi:Predicted metal-dependent phosphoesterases (PHP family)